MQDSYALIRSSTLSWLLEKVRIDDNLRDIPEDIARDLGCAIEKGSVKVQPTVDKLKILGPILDIEQHEQLLLDEPELGLPRDKHAGAFWRQVVIVVHSMLTNEAVEVLRLVQGENENGK